MGKTNRLQSKKNQSLKGKKKTAWWRLRNRNVWILCVVLPRECDIAMFHLTIIIYNVCYTVYELETLCRDYDGTQALTPACHGRRWMRCLHGESESVRITWGSVALLFE